MPKIFISYRREDSIEIAGRIYDRLEARFGADAVFMDVDNIPVGVDFRRQLDDAVATCDVLLAVMAREWLTVSKNGKRRLDDPRDFVRIEIEAALKRNIAVVPVLIGATAMPQEDDLPDALKPLAFRSAAKIDVGQDFRSHMERLIRALEQIGQPAQAKPAQEVGGERAKPKRKAGDVITNSIGMKLAWIPPGKFLMGSPTSEVDRQEQEHQHEVELTAGFYMGVYPVTQEEYARVINANPSCFAPTGVRDEMASMDTRRFPVESVTWHNALEFCRRLGESERKRYDLPTEAEWEYACRAGTLTAYYFGANLSSRQANFNETSGRTCAVGAYPANSWGLHDMHGSIYEWCKDGYAEEYYKFSPRADPEYTSGPERVIRGGTWITRARYCRSAQRNSISPDMSNYRIGFRVIMSFPEDSV
jgi:formylglycine-generating enzyme required for sulfatase activity